MKRIISLLLCLVLAAGLGLTAYGASSQHIYDEMGYLEQSVIDRIEPIAQSIQEETGLTVLYLSQEVSSEEQQDAADAVFRQAGLGTTGYLLLDRGDYVSIFSYGEAMEYDASISSALVDSYLNTYNDTLSIADSLEAYFTTAAQVLQGDLYGEPEQGDPLLPLETQPAPAGKEYTDGALVVDYADLLTDEEEEELLAMAREISDRQACDVVILTNDDLGGKTATAFADDFFDYNGYGQGPEESGILLLVSMGQRDYALSTKGFGITAFTDYGLEVLTDSFLSKLSSGNYYGAFRAYLEKSDELLTMARNGEPLDTNTAAKKNLRTFLFSPFGVLILLSIGFGLALIPMAVMRSKLKTVRKQQYANSYVRNGSLHLTRQKDTFLYHNTTSRVIETESRGGGGGGGGSSVHFSSSGSSHGGSSGKF